MVDQNKISVSVCIPVFNGEDFIDEAIKSVLNQTYQDFELIIVDNCSTDNTVNLITKYSDKRIKLYKNATNIGLIANWNKALEHASSEYIKILPADDIIYETCLQLQIDAFKRDIKKEISIVCGRKNIINKKGKILFNRGFSQKQICINGLDAINKTIRSGGNIIGEGGAILFRKEILKKTNVFNSDIFYVLDLDLWFKMLLHGKLLALPQTVSAFRISDISASVKVVDKQFSDNKQFIKKIHLQKEYNISDLTYNIGIIKCYLFTQAKKILYKFIL